MNAHDKPAHGGYPEQHASEASLAPAEWRAMVYAPLDGTEVELLLHHRNRQYAEGEARKQWEQIARAKWIDFNGGGWTWHGMHGTPQGWRPVGVPGPEHPKFQQ